jgi:hypothetical protein
MLVHLYFNPSTYGDYASANACFGVAADNLTHLDNFIFERSGI